MYILYNPQGNTEGHSQQYATNITNGLIDAGFSVEMVTSQDFDSSNINGKSQFKVRHTEITNTRSVNKDDSGFLGRLAYGALILRNNFTSFRALTKSIQENELTYLSIIGGDTLSNLMYLFFSFGLDKSKCSITIHNADYDLGLYRRDFVRYAFKLTSKLLLKLLVRSRLVIFTHGEIMSTALSVQLKCSADRIKFYRVPAVKVDLSLAGRRRANDPLKLLFLGVIRYDKGFDILCRSLAKLKSACQFELVVAGSAAQVGESYVFDLIERYDLRDRTSLELRYLSDTELEDYILNADITVLPYRKTFLAKSVVMSDTARLGTPAIATVGSQNGYDVDTFGVGWSFISEDHDDLVRVIELAINEVLEGNKIYGFDSYIEAHLPGSVGSQIKAAMENASVK